MIDIDDLDQVQAAIYSRPKRKRGRPTRNEVLERAKAERDASRIRERRQAALRAQTIARMYLEGDVTLEEIGLVYGVTRERIRQLLVLMGITKQTILTKRERYLAEARDETYKYSLEKLLERCANARVCITCYGWVLRSEKFKTCSNECAELWRVARYQLNEEAHEKQRQRSAKWTVRNETDPRKLASAKRILAHAPPNRRYIISGSLTNQAYQRALVLREQVQKYKAIR